MILNCITVDDEPLALSLLNAFVTKTPFLKLQQAYPKPSEALQGLSNPDVHLVFLDIHMPGVGGIEIARQLQEMAEPVPRVIFTTAHNQFAVESYEVDALSYLLKPFNYEGFLRAAQKGHDYFEKLAIEQLPTEKAHLFVKVGFQQVKIVLSDISFVQGLRDYVLIHLNSSESPVMTLTTLKALLEKLPENQFIRVQRSFIVNLNSVSIVANNSLWINNMEIKIGSQYKATVRAYFEKNSDNK